MTTDETAKTAFAARCAAGPLATGRKANAAPRRTIPSAASVSGTNSVDMIAANAGGNAVQRITRSKISQVWFASQTGPIASAMSARGAAPRLAPPAARSQKPAPKSAPPKTAYAVRPSHRTTAVACSAVTAAHRVAGAVRTGSRRRSPSP